jgi:hypothetical protein
MATSNCLELVASTLATEAIDACLMEPTTKPRRRRRKPTQTQRLGRQAMRQAAEAAGVAFIPVPYIFKEGPAKNPDSMGDNHAVEVSIDLDLANKDTTPTVDPTTEDNTQKVDLTTEDNTPTVDPTTEDNTPTVDLTTEDNTPTVDLTTIEDNTPTVDLATIEDNTPTVDLTTIEDNKPTVDLTTVEDNTPTVDLTTIEDNTPTVGQATKDLIQDQGSQTEPETESSGDGIMSRAAGLALAAGMGAVGGVLLYRLFFGR